MALGSVDEFKSRLTGGGARGNLFQVTLANPRGGLGVNLDIDFTAFMCEAAQLPASNVGTIVIPFRGRQLKVAGDRTFDSWNVTIINDVEMKVRNEMERWMNAIANHADAGGGQNPELYFAETHLKVINLDEGLVPFKLYPYQEEMFGRFNEHRFNIILACRQSGKSISVCAYLLWYALFHPEKTVAILANKASTAREMLSRITLMLENLPFFLQPGTKALNKGSLEFGNNSRIITAATTGSSIRGLSINLLYLDEFAFVEKASEFYTSTYPVVSAGKDTKVIITSTANGIGNMFYKIWEGAVQEVDDFTHFRVDWYDVPGRDEAWKQQTINNTSKLQFDQEFGNTFLELVIH